MDDSLVILFDKKMNISITLVNSEQKSELNGYNFRPPNIPSIFVPIGAKSPVIPFIVENNANTPQWGSINPKFNGGSSWGFTKREPQNSEDNWVHHHSISDRTLELGVLCVKGDEAWLKELVKCESEGRHDLPSGMAKEQWTRVLRIDSVSFLENFWLHVQGSNLER